MASNTGFHHSWWALVPAAISAITQPSAKESFLVDLTYGLLQLSPLYSISRVASSLFLFLSWKILRVGSVSTCLSLTAISHFHWPNPKHLSRVRAKYYTIIRWAVFLSCTMSQYVLQMRSGGVEWVRFVTTCMAISFVHTEISLRFADQRLVATVQRGWPKENLIKLASPAQENADAREESTGKSPIQQTHKPVNQRLNGCEAIRLLVLRPEESGLDMNGKIPGWMRMGLFWTALFNPSPVWTCSHARCLLYKVNVNLALILPTLWPLYEVIFVTWALHGEIRAGVLSDIEKVMSHSIYRELLTIIWITCVVILVIVVPLILYTAALVTLFERNPSSRNLLENFKRQNALIRNFISLFLLSPPLVGGFIAFRWIKPNPSTSIVLPWVIELATVAIMLTVSVSLSSKITGLDLKDAIQGSGPDEEVYPVEITKGDYQTSRTEDLSTDARKKEQQFVFFVTFSRILILALAAAFWYFFRYRWRPKTMDLREAIQLSYLRKGALFD